MAGLLKKERGTQDSAGILSSLTLPSRLGLAKDFRRRYLSRTFRAVRNPPALNK